MGTKKNYKIGVIGLTAIGVGTMIGSGWLFSSYYAAKIAGVDAYISWVFAAIIVTLLGLCLAEIVTIFPKRGLMARLIVLSHNKEFAFIFTVATWLGLTAVIATEAAGSVQYISTLSTKLRPIIFNIAKHQLTIYGLLIASCMIVIFGIINYWGIKLLSHSNVLMTICKIVIPVVTAIAIIFTVFHTQNFSNHLLKKSTDNFSAIFIAMIGAGMVYSFNGFQNIVSFAEEAKNPKRDIPIAIFLAIIITLLVYVLLQTAFIGSMNPTLIQQKGWTSINFTSPFVQIVALLNLNFITMILYIDSVVSPSGTGLIYAGSTTRLLTAMSQEKQMPSFFNKYSKHNFSRRSLIFTIFLAIIFLMLFKSWVSLVSLLTLLYIISYMSIPLCLSKLHYKKIKGSFKLPMPNIVLPIMFVLLSWLYMFAKFPYTGYVALFAFIVYALFLIAQFENKNSLKQKLKNSFLMFVYLIILGIISFLGPKVYGGIGFVSSYVFFGFTAFVALIMFYLVRRI